MVLALQTEPLPDEIEHTLDCAVECGDIDVASAVILKLYGSRPLITALLKYHAAPADRTISIHEALRQLTAHATGLWSGLDRQVETELVLMSFTHLRYAIDQLAKACAAWAMEDLTDGGALQAFRLPPGSLWCGAAPSPKNRRKLYSPRWIRRYIKHLPEAVRIRDTASTVMARATMSSVHPQNVTLGHVDRLLDAYQKNQRTVALASLIRQPGIGMNGADASKRRKMVRQRRKTTAKASAVASQVLGPQSVSAFVRGEPIEIPGPTLTLRLSSAGSIEHDGHGALRTEIVSHTGEPLGGLCVYIENTPALDQLAALSLYMSDAESEAELLSKSNLIALTEAGRSHPALAARHRDSGAFDVIDQVSDVFRRVRVRNDAYWADTGRIWTDTITIHAVGARVAPRLSAFVDTFRTLRHDADREATQEVAA